MAKIQDTLIFTRPNKDTMFPSQYGELYSDTIDPIRQLMTERKVEGKRVRKSSTISEDGLKQTVIVEFDSEASRTEFYENSISKTAITNRDSYCNAKSITITETTKEI